MPDNSLQVDEVILACLILNYDLQRSEIYVLAHKILLYILLAESQRPGLHHTCSHYIYLSAD